MNSKIAQRIKRALAEVEGNEPKNFWKNLVTLPSPRDLGWSKHNALEDEEFSDNPRGKTWQDWHRHVKQAHPTKYLFVETIPKFFRYKVWFPVKRPFEKAHYWFVSHVIPSRRYHMLDLRQEGGYRYGWQDVPEKMLYAMFNLLGEYLNEETPHDLTDYYTEEQIEADVGLKSQQDSINEARAIYHWWKVGRKQEEQAITEARDTWYKNRKKGGKQEYWDKLRELEEAYENKTDEMITRLMKIRRTLWT
jgi:hypothetical protein